MRQGLVWLHLEKDAIDNSGRLLEFGKIAQKVERGMVIGRNGNGAAVFHCPH